jgi:hypothetical protein
LENKRLIIVCNPDTDSFQSLYQRVFDELFHKDENDEILLVGLELFIKEDLKEVLKPLQKLDAVARRLSMVYGVAVPSFRVEETEKGLLIARPPGIKMPNFGPPAF